MSWKELYKAAIFEPDKTKILERIADAEIALAMRARELFHGSGDNTGERQELDASMSALHTLRTLVALAPQNRVLPLRADSAKAA